MSAAGNIGQNSSKEAACGGVFCARRGPLSTPPVALPVVSFFRLTDSCNMSLFKPRLGFVLACIFLDALGIGLIVPVLPRLIGTLTTSHDAQTWWYGMIMLSYGVMQFVSAPLLGALSDRYGRRPVLLAGICGLSVMFAVPAFFASLPAILASRIAGGMLSANMAVAQAYVARPHDRLRTVGCVRKNRRHLRHRLCRRTGTGRHPRPERSHDSLCRRLGGDTHQLSSTDSLPCRSRSPIRTRGPCPLRQAPPLPRLRRCCASQERAFFC